MQNPDQDVVVVLREARGPAADCMGRKAEILARLAMRGFAVPDGFVVTPEAFTAGDRLSDAAARLIARRTERLGGPFAVRSSAVAEDRAYASYAGLYETVLGVPGDGLVAAVERVRRSARAARVSAYAAAGTGGHAGQDVADPGAAGMAVLVQVMVDAAAAGVAFTASPLTGDRDETIVNAVPGLGEALVSGQADGEQWTVHGDRPVRTRTAPGGEVLTTGQVAEVTALARAVEAELGGPQDLEWALDRDGRVWLLQARPMTALPEPVDWSPPAPGHWMRTFRLGEWLPEPMTPLFADWPLRGLEAGYLAGMRATVGVAVPFRYTAIHGWYYTAPPLLSPGLLLRVLGTGRVRLVRVVFNALVRVGRDPVAADRAVLADLAQLWATELLPAYRAAVADAETRVARADPAELRTLVDRLGDLAGRYLWSLAIVGGSAWKMEAALTRFCADHLAAALDGAAAQHLVAGLPGVDPTTPPHAVLSVDWFHPTTAELPLPVPSGQEPAPGGPDTPHSSSQIARTDPAAVRVRLEASCREALRHAPRLARRFDALLEVTQRYAVIREQQARDFTLAWPVLRAAVLRLGRQLTDDGHLTGPDQVFFLTRRELDQPGPGLLDLVAARRSVWERQRRLVAPLTVGAGQKLAERAVASAVTAARGTHQTPAGSVIGHPASPGRATGPVRLVTGPDDFAAFATGDVLVARATAPAWTPLFARAAAVVTDAGTLAAHASLIAREYGIPAVVGTGDATTRLHTGQLVTVDGTAGTVHPIAATTD